MFTFLLMFLKAHLPFAPQNMDYAGLSPIGNLIDLLKKFINM